MFFCFFEDVNSQLAHFICLSAIADVVLNELCWVFLFCSCFDSIFRPYHRIVRACGVLSCRVCDLFHPLWYECIFGLVFYGLVPFCFLFLFLYSIRKIHWANWMWRKLTQPTRDRERGREAKEKKRQNQKSITFIIKMRNKIIWS